MDSIGVEEHVEGGIEGLIGVVRMFNFVPLFHRRLPWAVQK
jgi:hypothetical protein